MTVCIGECCMSKLDQFSCVFFRWICIMSRLVRVCVCTRALVRACVCLKTLSPVKLLIVSQWSSRQCWSVCVCLCVCAAAHGHHCIADHCWKHGRLDWRLLQAGLPVSALLHRPSAQRWDAFEPFQFCVCYFQTDARQFSFHSCAFLLFSSLQRETEPCLQFQSKSKGKVPLWWETWQSDDLRKFDIINKLIFAFV